MHAWSCSHPIHIVAVSFHLHKDSNIPGPLSQGRVYPAVHHLAHQVPAQRPEREREKRTLQISFSPPPEADKIETFDLVNAHKVRFCRMRLLVRLDKRRGVDCLMTRHATLTHPPTVLAPLLIHPLPGSRQQGRLRLGLLFGGLLLPRLVVGREPAVRAGPEADEAVVVVVKGGERRRRRRRRVLLRGNIIVLAGALFVPAISRVLDSSCLVAHFSGQERSTRWIELWLGVLRAVDEENHCGGL